MAMAASAAVAGSVVGPKLLTGSSSSSSRAAAGGMVSFVRLRGSGCVQSPLLRSSCSSTAGGRRGGALISVRAATVSLPSSPRKSTMNSELRNFTKGAMRAVMRSSSQTDNSTTQEGGDCLSILEYEEVIGHFWDRISYELPNIQHKLPAEPDVLDHFTLLGLDSDYMPKTIRVVKTASALADCTYRFHPHPVRVAIGLFTTYLILIDDIEDEFMDDLLNFRRRLLQGKEQPNILLRSYLKFLPSLDRYYGDYTCDMIYKSSIEFVSCCTLEKKFDKQGRKLVPPGAALFPEFFRLKTGLSEAYTHFLFLKADFPEDQYLGFYLLAIPDLGYAFNFLNDLFSFYKESIGSTERFNYVYNFANAHGLSPYDALQEISKFTVKHVMSAREILAANPQMEKIVEDFVQGYITWHWLDQRYRLTELCISPKGMAAS